MNHLPIMAKVFLNVFLYCVYVVVTSLIFSLLFPILLQVLGKTVLDPLDPVFMKIQIFIAVLVLLLTLILRKYFYIALKHPVREIKESYTIKKAQEKVQKKPEVQMEGVEDDEIKIYVEKEIK